MLSTSSRIRTVIIDDHQMVVESLSRVLAADDQIDLTGCAFSSADGVALCAALRPDVAVVDFRLPDADGPATARAILEASPSTRILILTGLHDDGLVLDAIEAGSSGFLTKDSALAELTSAIRVVNAQEAYIPAPILARFIEPFGPRSEAKRDVVLTRREVQVLSLVREGNSNQAVADQLCVSLHTVRNHVQNILGKLGAHFRPEAVAIAVRSGLLSV